MIIYLFKVIACSALFYAFYFLLLRNEKMLLFNRVYLLSTLIAAFLMPRATITVKQPVLPVAVTELRVVEEPGWQEALFYWSLVLFMVVSFLLMIRLVRNLLKISHSVQSYPHVWWRGTRVVLVGQPVMAHSFLKNIFLSKEEFEHGDIEEEVLEHEWAHVRQRHSWDILFIELLHTVSWFNPVMYLYKRSIKINHELLADAAVIKRRGNIRNYQHILLQRAGARPSADPTMPRKPRRQVARRGGKGVLQGLSSAKPPTARPLASSPSAIVPLMHKSFRIKDLPSNKWFR